MSEEEILCLIREALVYAAPEKAEMLAQLDWNSSLAGLGVDSIGLLEASAFIEEKLDASFPDDKLARVDRVADFGALIREHFGSTESVTG